ncbi:1,4-dihydroxy-2-naphthoate polyprenyltransferase [Paenibacillus yanchengensis]|uniref:1,4-dihydroxy-2-naphthoate polyprenyltransferase n=1 Tax=Paenibacillus yanchengensis TaxID=2035833 RepID=A0ABW4YIG4_9BACL
MHIITKFFKLVELPTKVASMIPFLLGSLYAWYYFDTFSTPLFLLMLVSLLFFDMTTTAINNLFDYVKAKKRHGYGYEEHNAIVKYKMNPIFVFILILIMFLSSVFAGLVLVSQTNLVVLVLGFLSFGVGILYSFGPIPISRMPLGELFSGLFMGFVITFVAAYIHSDGGQLATITLLGSQLSININIVEILLILLISIPTILGIANIMLANNISDIDEDIVNKRYTLPHYIGKSNALYLFRYLYYASYLDIPILIYLGVPWWLALAIIITVIPVHKNINTFVAAPSKGGTFHLAVKNFIIISMARVIVLFIAVLLQ